MLNRLYFNILFLVMMGLLSVSQIAVIWLYIKSRHRVPPSNILTTLGSLLLTLAAYLSLHTSLFDSSSYIILYIGGMILLVAGGIGSYRHFLMNRSRATGYR
jgi:hypothetical protein